MDFSPFSLALTHSVSLSPTKLWHSRLMSAYNVESPPATSLSGQSILKKLDTGLGVQPDEPLYQGSVMLIKSKFSLCFEPPSHPWPFLIFLADTRAKQVIFHLHPPPPPRTPSHFSGPDP